MAPKISLNPKDAVVGGGLFGPGKAKIIRSRIGKYGYPDKKGNDTRKPVTAAIITFKRGDEKHPEAFTVGEGFKPSKDGLSLVPLSGSSGLTDSCKFMRFLKSLSDAGMPDKIFAQLGEDISGLEGLLVQLTRKTLPRFEGQRGNKRGNDPTILLVDDILKAPFKLGKKVKPVDADEDEDEDEEEEEDEDSSKDEDEDEDEDDDEKPAKKKKGKAADDDDEDEDDDADEDADEDEDDEKPAKKKKSTKAKGKAAADDDDDEDADDAEDEDDDDAEADEDVVEAAGEKLIDALEDGPIKKAKVRDAVAAEAKKDKKTKAQAVAIGKYAATEKFLKSENGWSYDGKTVTAD